jgi:ribose/xylose/arabinose/galactoside ABC-type transport system permease subunit
MITSDNAMDRRKIANLRQVMPVILLLVMILVLSIFNKVFLSVSTLRSMLLQVSAIGVLAMGAMVVIIAGGIDFTLGFGVWQARSCSRCPGWPGTFGFTSYFPLWPD